MWTIWEGYPTAEEHSSSITFKLVCFQIVNYYFNLYYTAFIKGLYQSCVYNDCRAEIGQQLNIMFAIFIVEDIFYFLQAKREVEEREGNIKNSDNRSSKKEIYYRDTYGNSVQEEYMQIILVFGYVIQFGAASPLCLPVAFAHGMLARYTDSYKFIKFVHVNFCCNFLIQLEEKESDFSIK